MRRGLWLFFLILLNVSGHCQKSFTNPLFDSGADPWITRKDGFYYYTSTSGSKLFIKKAQNLNDLKSAESVTIWTPPEGTSYSREIWAPELHFIDDKWYMYFAADDGKNENHRMYVVENSSPDPTLGTWVFKGKVSDKSDKWAIDGSVFWLRGELYFVWSGWEGDVDGQQNIYIARMSNPWTIDSERVLISEPEHEWERVGDIKMADSSRHVNVNEGPVVLKNRRKTFLVFSASGCWTDAYCLGMLTLTGKDPLDRDSWTKNPESVFSANPEGKAYAPGHNSFFKSPDGQEYWIMYHANPDSGRGCGRFRSPRAQEFTFRNDGTPFFGAPVEVNREISTPSEK